MKRLIILITVILLVVAEVAAGSAEANKYKVSGVKGNVVELPTRLRYSEKPGGSIVKKLYRKLGIRGIDNRNNGNSYLVELPVGWKLTKPLLVPYHRLLDNDTISARQFPA